MDKARDGEARVEEAFDDVIDDAWEACYQLDLRAMRSELSALLARTAHID